MYALLKKCQVLPAVQMPPGLQFVKTPSMMDLQYHPKAGFLKLVTSYWYDYL